MIKNPTSRPVQLSLSFEQPQFDNILDLLNHVIHSSGKEFKHIAADLDRAPGELRMMLSGYEGRKFPVNDLPKLIESCGTRGQMIVHWFVGQFLTPPENRVAQAADALLEFAKLLPAIQKAAEVVLAAQGGKKK